MMHAAFWRLCGLSWFRCCLTVRTSVDVKMMEFLAIIIGGCLDLEVVQPLLPNDHAPQIFLLLTQINKSIFGHMTICYS